MAKEKHLFDDPKNVRRLLVMFFGAVVLLLSLDLFVHNHHTHFPFEA